MPATIRAPTPLWPKTFRMVRIGSHGEVAIPPATATVAQPTKKAATRSVWPSPPHESVTTLDEPAQAADFDLIAGGRIWANR
jgi:hypothetical protein